MEAINVLNRAYKIIAKIIATRLKTILPKIIHIHVDEKGFVKGRNINEANRLFQDIIDYIDMENEEGRIIFINQQTAFDCTYPLRHSSGTNDMYDSS